MVSRPSLTITRPPTDSKSGRSMESVKNRHGDRPDESGDHNDSTEAKFSTMAQPQEIAIPTNEWR